MSQPAVVKLPMGKQQETFSYQLVVGALMYLGVHTKPDIAYVVNAVLV